MVVAESSPSAGALGEFPEDSSRTRGPGVKTEARAVVQPLSLCSLWTQGRVMQVDTNLPTRPLHPFGVFMPL